MDLQGTRPQPAAPAARQSALVANDASGQYLTFDLGGDAFAVEILSIKEIIEYRQPTPVPGSPDSVRGVINLRGCVVPVLDPRVRFGQSPSSVGKRSCIVIAEIDADQGSQVVGVLVDAVSEVVQLAADEIEPPPAFGTRVRADFIQGIAKVRGRLVLILEMHRILSDSEPLLRSPAATIDRTEWQTENLLA